ARCVAMHQRTSEATQTTARVQSEAATAAQVHGSCPRQPVPNADSPRTQDTVRPSAPPPPPALAATPRPHPTATPCLTNLDARTHETSSLDLHARSQIRKARGCCLQPC